MEILPREIHLLWLSELDIFFVFRNVSRVSKLFYRLIQAIKDPDQSKLHWIMNFWLSKYQSYWCRNLELLKKNRSISIDNPDWYSEKSLSLEISNPTEVFYPKHSCESSNSHTRYNIDTIILTSNRNNIVIVKYDNILAFYNLENLKNRKTSTIETSGKFLYLHWIQEGEIFCYIYHENNILYFVFVEIMWGDEGLDLLNQKKYKFDELFDNPHISKHKNKFIIYDLGTLMATTIYEITGQDFTDFYVTYNIFDIDDNPVRDHFTSMMRTNNEANLHYETTNVDLFGFIFNNFRMSKTTYPNKLSLYKDFKLVRSYLWTDILDEIKTLDGPSAGYLVAKHNPDTNFILIKYTYNIAVSKKRKHKIRSYYKIDPFKEKLVVELANRKEYGRKLYKTLSHILHFQKLNFNILE